MRIVKLLIKIIEGPLMLQFDPYWGVVARFFPATNFAVDSGCFEMLGHLGAKQEVIDAKTCVAAKGVPEIIPESIYFFAGVKVSDCIGPSLIDEGFEGRADFGPEEGVVYPLFRFVYIYVRWHDVIVSRQDNRFTGCKEAGCVLCQSLEPAQLVIEFWPGGGVAVGQIEATYDDVLYHCFDITAMYIFQIAG